MCVWINPYLGYGYTCACTCAHTHTHPFSLTSYQQHKYWIEWKQIKDLNVTSGNGDWEISRKKGGCCVLCLSKPWKPACKVYRGQTLWHISISGGAWVLHHRGPFYKLFDKWTSTLLLIDVEVWVFSLLKWKRMSCTASQLISEGKTIVGEKYRWCRVN